jgi:hypothetical protein
VDVFFFGTLLWKAREVAFVYPIQGDASVLFQEFVRTRAGECGRVLRKLLPENILEELKARTYRYGRAQE